LKYSEEDDGERESRTKNNKNKEKEREREKSASTNVYQGLDQAIDRQRERQRWGRQWKTAAARRGVLDLIIIPFFSLSLFNLYLMSLSRQ
jgi:hypothetical protein